MARITVTSGDGRMTHSERVIPQDLDATYSRECLIERLRWAIGDAEGPGDEVRCGCREPLSPHTGRSGLRQHVERGRGQQSPRRTRALASSW
jgi:hypothetical protein